MIAIGEAYCPNCEHFAPVTASGVLMPHGSLDTGECAGSLSDRVGVR